MLGLIIQLAVSWLLIWFFEKGNLFVLGFQPTQKRLLNFLLFFLITAAFCASVLLMQMYFAKQVWQLNPDLSVKLIFQGFGGILNRHYLKNLFSEAFFCIFSSGNWVS